MFELQQIFKEYLRTNSYFRTAVNFGITEYEVKQAVKEGFRTARTKTLRLDGFNFKVHGNVHRESKGVYSF